MRKKRGRNIDVLTPRPAVLLSPFFPHFLHPRRDPHLVLSGSLSQPDHVPSRRRMRCTGSTCCISVRSGPPPSGPSPPDPPSACPRSARSARPPLPHRCSP